MSSTNYNYTAVLKGENMIEAVVNKPFNSPLIKDMRLYEDGKYVSDLKFLARSESQSTFIYSFAFDYKIVPGKYYELQDGRNEASPLNLTYLCHTKEFENTYRYDGEMGAIYSKESTTFRVFSPLASEVVVKLISPKNSISFISLNRMESGVYEGEGLGDLSGYGYLYIARINGDYVSAIDPYAKSVNMNSKMGYIVDLDKFSSIPLNDEDLPPFSDPCKAIIYELDVRDMTSLTSLKNKGTYNALAKEGQKDENGNPIGIDYIASLGVSHVQLLPVFDFQTIRDDAPSKSYNWGYDPINFFSPEGSYSSDPDDPYKRILELRNLVSSFHKKGIRVNMDVVFNHTMSYLTSSFNRLCPDYYYRFNEDGKLSTSSGCGNDTESRNYMMRKLIIDNLVYFAKYYGMDGFRFDLMGILDKDTVNKAYFYLKGMKPSIMMYGEGWDMPTMMDASEKASMNNAFSMADIGFFNDRFRDVVRGKSFGRDMSQKGYLTGDANYIDGFKHVCLGSVISLAFPPLFESPKQSINYVECHDDGALYDKVKACSEDDSEDDVLRRINLINICSIMSFGVPFIHAGQEYGHSKDGNNNTYNAGDKLNGFDYSLAYKRIKMVNMVKDAIKMKKAYPEFSLSDKREIMKKINFEDLSNGALAIKFSDDSGKIKFIAIINPSKVTVKYQFDHYFKIIFNEAGFINEGLYSELVLVNGLSLIVASSSE